MREELLKFRSEDRATRWPTRTYFSAGTADERDGAGGAAPARREHESAAGAGWSHHHTALAMVSPITGADIDHRWPETSCTHNGGGVVTSASGWGRCLRMTARRVGTAFVPMR